MCIITYSHQYFAPEGSKLHFLCLWHMYMCVYLGRHLPLQYMRWDCHSCLWVVSPVCIWADLSNNMWYKTKNLEFVVKFMCWKCLHILQLGVCIVQWQISPHAQLLQFTLTTTTDCYEEHWAATLSIIFIGQVQMCHWLSIIMNFTMNIWPQWHIVNAI
jgi:hypothetical protein